MIHRIVILIVALIAAVGGQRDDFESRYNYEEQSCYNMMPSQMMASNMPSQTVETAKVHAKFMNKGEAMYTYEPGHEYSSKSLYNRLQLAKPLTVTIFTSAINEINV